MSVFIKVYRTVLVEYQIFNVFTTAFLLQKIFQLVQTIGKFVSGIIIISNLPEMPLKSMFEMFNDHPTPDVHKNIGTRLTWGHTFKHIIHYIKKGSPI